MPRYSRKFKVNKGTQTDDGKVERIRPSYRRIITKRRLAELLEAVGELEEAGNQNAEEQEQAIDLTEDSREVSGCNTNNTVVGVNYLIIIIAMITTISGILIASWKTL